MTGTDVPAFSARGLEMRFGREPEAVTALTGVDLDIRPGSFLAIVGPSGCGKSTLLRCLAGLVRHTGGTLVRSEAITGSAGGIGMVFQRNLLLDWRSVRNNVLLTADMRHGTRAPFEDRADRLLKRFGLEAFARHHPWQLSGGMRQRVAICRALLDDPDTLMMDEPFGALDAMTRDDLNQELQTIWMETGKLVVFVTHDITEAIYLADTVVVMAARPGRVVDTITVDLPRPRPLSCRTSPAFGALSERVRASLAGTAHPA